MTGIDWDLIERLLEREEIDEDDWDNWTVYTTITDDYGAGYFQIYAELVRKEPKDDD
jgi:hypothetical protein